MGRDFRTCLKSLPPRLNQVSEFIERGTHWFTVKDPSGCCETRTGRGGDHKGDRGETGKGQGSLEQMGTMEPVCTCKHT